ncbi:MAG: hypothetical protein AAF519_01700 [Bacteroidota bacterium]
MRKIKALLLSLVFCIGLTSCFTLNHTVGNGAQGGDKTEKKQWYALWGLVPINDVDSKQMAAGAEDYTITSTHSFLDVVVSLFTGFVTIQVKTVKVEK